MSDNATTFLTAGEVQQSLMSSTALADNLARRGVEWRFIPKCAPWFAGFWERLIGLTKSALQKVLTLLLVNSLGLGLYQISHYLVECMNKS